MKRFSQFLVEGKIPHFAITPKEDNALSWNNKVGFYSFDVTTDCQRGCPGCYVDRGREIECNAKKKIKELDYYGELQKWEDRANRDEKFAKVLADAKMQVNRNGGIRMFAAGDYDPTNEKHSDDEIEKFLDDCLACGWQAKAITKEKIFLRKFGKHKALGTIDLSMNKDGFGFSHQEVIDYTKNPEFGKKIKGRMMVFTPHDIHDILKMKDMSHIGVITGGHGFAATQTVAPVKPFDRAGEKKVYYFANFPKELKTLFNSGEIEDASRALALLNDYTKKFNKKVNEPSEKAKLFTIDDIRHIAKMAKNKMCCVGGKCDTCTAKCGSGECEPH